MQILKCIVTICLVFAFLLTAASHERWKTDPENLVIKACSDSDACRAAPCKPDCNSQENCLVWTTLPDTILSGTWFYYVYVYGAVEMLVKFEDRIKLWNWHSGRCITFEGGWCALAQNVTLKKYCSNICAFLSVFVFAFGNEVVSDSSELIFITSCSITDASILSPAYLFYENHCKTNN